MTTKILVADDSATMRRVLEMTFAGEDAQVVAVASGQAAVAKAAELTPDVIFADASMDGVDGYEVAKQIKESPGLSDITVVVMASQQSPYDEARGRSCGVDDHISKPFDSQLVIDRVSQIASRPRSRASSSGQSAQRPPRPPAPPPQGASRYGSTLRTSPAAQRPDATVAGIGLHGPAPGPRQPAPAQPAQRQSAPAQRQPAPPQQPAQRQPAPPQRQPAPPQPAAQRQPSPVASAGASTTRPSAPRGQPLAAVERPNATVDATSKGSPLAERLADMGLSSDQVAGVLALSREVIEQVVWEVVPELAETLIKEEIERLTSD